mmetsp:Transcript_68844/g.107786  ORF Transcript_68844/g.107786 Transcript_68844/m.107786 type:complete len:328 (-) Transcript_68844:78-1061(-)
METHDQDSLDVSCQDDVETKANIASVVTALPASPMPAQTTEVDPAIDGCSVSSECECPVCYQLFCEPVRAGCDRHVFCRNCLMKAQGVVKKLKCPICRAESQRNVTELPEVEDMVEKLKRKDPQYDDRVTAAKKEREEYIQARLVRMTALTDGRASRQFEVCGAGSEEVNGVYVAGVLPTYVGPTVYRKPNTYLFIFRWRQTDWIIAELHGPYSMGNEREWLYRAPTQYPPDIPPMQGWEVPTHGRACRPAPEVRIIRNSAPTTASPTTGTGSPPTLNTTIVRRRGRYSGSSPDAAGNASLEDVWWPANGLEGDQVRCRCGPSCSIM